MENKDFSDIQILNKGMIEAGKIALDFWQKGVKAEIKSANYDVTSRADREVEAYLISWIRGNFSKVSIFGEETGGKISKDCFTVDGVDGSSFFAAGLPDWAISLSRIQNGEVVFGMVYSPVLNELYWAKKGLGTYLNGEKIHVSHESNIECAIVNLGQDIIRMYGRLDLEGRFIKVSRAHYVTASSALAYGRLAAGKIHVAVHMGQPIWDFAPGKILVEEARGEFTNWNNTKDFALVGGRVNNILASNGILHNKAIRLIE